jgi:hypothetical protein
MKRLPFTRRRCVVRGLHSQWLAGIIVGHYVERGWFGDHHAWLRGYEVQFTSGPSEIIGLVAGIGASMVYRWPVCEAL